jgi:iron complex transport system ATP-binding protein
VKALALELQNVCVSLGEQSVLKNVNLQVPVGRWLAVVGPNGSGKSTLLRAAAGLLPLQQGQVLWQDMPLQAWGRTQRARNLAWLAQTAAPSAWGSDDLRVSDVVMLGRLPHQDWLGSETPQDTRAVEAALHAQDLWALRQRRLSELSGGERQRVQLARAWVQNTAVVLMDEPLSHVDMPHQLAWAQQVRKHVARGTTVVSVLHDMNLALLADEVAVLTSSGLIHHGRTSDEATHQAMSLAFEHSFEVMQSGQQRWIRLLYKD